MNIRYSVKTFECYNEETAVDALRENHFQTFEDLKVYQLAREFRMAMCAVARLLPDFERFALASQIRRAAVSLFAETPL